MKSIHNVLIISLLFAFLLNGCSVQQSLYTYTAPYTPEESGLGITKITDDNIDVIGSKITYGIPQTSRQWVGGIFFGSYQNVTNYKNPDKVFHHHLRMLAISPDGKDLAFISEINEQFVACTRKLAQGNQLTQRTFRPTLILSWGSDDKIYFADDSYKDRRPICSVNSRSGSIMKQHTNSNSDKNPILSKDGKKLFFERVDNNGESSIWCYDLQTSSLMLCCAGACPYPIDKEGKKLLCCRAENSNYAIWIVDYEKGEESILLSSPEQSFTSPVLSPDGKWVVFEGNVYSPLSQKDQLDIYCVKMDGSNLTQLTSHPYNDFSPVWSADGKQIYFISERASSNKTFGVWRMNFKL